MVKKLSVIAAVVCAFAFIGTVSADPVTTVAAGPDQTMAAQHGKRSVSVCQGNVVSVNATASQITVQSTTGKMETLAFDVSAATNIRKAGKAIVLTDITSSDKVIVAYKAVGTKNTATAIRVKTALPAAPAGH